MFNNKMSLYGNYRTRKFTDIYESVEDFISSYKNCGIPTTIQDNSAETLYYLLYARYGNSHIASSDENQFIYKLMSIIYSAGPTWEKRVEIQNALREMDISELQESAKAIYNHSYNPSTQPSTNTLEELVTINDQNVTKHKRSKLDAYAMLVNLLDTDVTSEFINRFKPLFLTIVEPECPLWYITTLQGENNNDN